MGGCCSVEDQVNHEKIARAVDDRNQRQEQHNDYHKNLIESPTSTAVTNNNGHQTHTPTSDDTDDFQNNKNNEYGYSNRFESVIVPKKLPSNKRLMANAHHLRNVFAAPLGDTKDFVAPEFPKSVAEKNFIATALKKNFVFASMQERELTTLIHAFEKFRAEKGDVIIRQGDRGDYFYVLERGSVVFKVDDRVVGKTSAAGSTFGELALLYTSPRAATVVADSDEASLFKVDQKTFRYILQAQTEQTETDKRELLKGIPFFGDEYLDESDIRRLLGTMTPRPFKAGEYIIRKGEAGDAFYIIQEGKIKVANIEVGHASYEDQTLGPGDYFGEAALFTNEPRTANCIGRTKGILLRIDADVFIKAVGDLKRLAVKTEDKRKLAAIKPIQDSHLDPASLAALANLIVDQKYKKGDVIIQLGKEQKPALYLVRQGKLRLDRQQDGQQVIEHVQAGAYFGERMLKADCENDFCQLFKPKMTVTAVTDDVELGVLYLHDCRQVIDTTLIGKSNQFNPPTKVNSLLDDSANIRLQDLEKHVILGAGTFGQVWLVSPSNKKKSSSTPRPFALKIQSKYELVQTAQAKGVVQERILMAQLHTPFIIQLHQTYQDISYIYMLLGLVQGGELFSILHRPTGEDGIAEEHAQFYAAGVMEGLAYMHRRHILYRDLKPENVLIDNQGYPVIVDLGFAKKVLNKTYTLCGTPLYLAPEVILNRGHNAGADHWSFGVLVFEMIAGYTPFYEEGMDQLSLFRSIVKAHLKFPRAGTMSLDAEGLVAKLLVKEPAQRLGSLAKGEADIFHHLWFAANVDFTKLRRREIRAPWIPEIKNPLDSSNFDNWDHLEDKTLGQQPLLSAEEQKIFESF